MCIICTLRRAERWFPGRMHGPYFKASLTCDECGERFWGMERARYCSSACRQRGYRARKPGLGPELGDVCREVVERLEDRYRGVPSKLLPRLFRATAAELRRRGWDPIELLMGMPQDPVTQSDASPGGIEHYGSRKRKWLHPPEVELQKLEAAIALREEERLSTEWHRERREKLLRLLEATQRKPRRQSSSGH